MGIINYFGPFDKKGNIINRTVVECECDQCGYTWTARYKQAKESHSSCRACTRYGAPYTPQQVFDDYEEIVEIGQLSARGGVTNNTIVSVSCSDCNMVYDTPFRNVKKVNKTRDSWRCQPCSQIDRYNDIVLYPNDIEDLVVSIDYDTLGHRGQIKNNTVVTIFCDMCDSEFDRYWMNFNTDENFCKSCTMKTKWENDPEYTKNVFDGIGNGTISSGHSMLKEMLLNAGVAGFKSEQNVCNYRVDELHEDKKIIIEYFGSYWHADPRIYHADDLIRGRISAGEIWERDRQRIEKLESSGYCVIIVWEKDFLENPSNVIEGIIEIIGDIPIKVGE